MSEDQTRRPRYPPARVVLYYGPSDWKKWQAAFADAAKNYAYPTIVTSAPAKKVMKDGVGIEGRKTMWAKQKEAAASRVKQEEPPGATRSTEPTRQG